MHNRHNRHNNHNRHIRHNRNGGAPLREIVVARQAVGPVLIKEFAQPLNSCVADEKFCLAIFDYISCFTARQRACDRGDIQPGALGCPIDDVIIRQIGQPDRNRVAILNAERAEKLRSLICASLQVALTQSLGGIGHDDGWMIGISGSMDAGVGHNVTVSRRILFDKTYVTR